MMNTLTAGSTTAPPLLRMAESTPTSLWNDSATPSELRDAIGWGAVGATCNPVIALAALRAVGPSGRVISYEVREDFHRAAQAAVEDSLGAVPSNLELKIGDVYEGISEREVDRVLLDLPEPWQAVAHVAEALRPGGLVFAHCPNVSQVQRFFDCLREVRGFGMLEAFELLQRGWTVRGRSLRPSHRMVAHTGFLCFARRLAEDELFEPEGEGFR